MTTKSYAFIFFGLLLISTTRMGYCQAVDRIDSLKRVEPGDPKNPRLAAALSILLPGLGNVYADEPARGAIHFGTVIGGIGLVSAAKISSTHDSITPFGWFAVCTLAASYVWGIIDCALLGERLPAASDGPPLPGSAARRIETHAAIPLRSADRHFQHLVSLQLTF